VFHPRRIWACPLQRGTEAAEESDVARQFREAAERLRKTRELEQMSADARIAHSLRAYMAEWKDDLDARPPEAVRTVMGVQARSRAGIAKPALQSLSKSTRVFGCRPRVQKSSACLHVDTQCAVQLPRCRAREALDATHAPGYALLRQMPSSVAGEQRVPADGARV
jgi:hypothetical protein